MDVWMYVWMDVWMYASMYVGMKGSSMLVCGYVDGMVPYAR